MIIGIAGSFGSGKGTVVEYLESVGFKHFSASGFITEEIQQRNMPVDRDSMIVVANDLRKNNGPSYIIDSLYKRAQETGENVVIESLRAVAEVQRIKELGGVVLGVDASLRLRYERALARKSEKDNVSFEKWSEQEEIESNNLDPYKQNIFAALKESDHIIMNDGTIEELHEKVEEWLQTLP